MNTEFSVIPHAETKPSVSSTRPLRPYPPGTSFHCVTCGLPQAHWHLLHPRYGSEDTNICALCFLYTSGWLVKERGRRVDMVVSAIQLRKGVKMEFVLGPHGDKVWPPKLLNVSDADNVLGAITLQDRVWANQAAMDTIKKALGGTA